MKNLIQLFVIMALLSGCANTPKQEPISLDSNFWNSQNKKVGIVMSAIPSIDVYLPGADCLLCLAAAEVANSSISKQVKTFEAEGLSEIPKLLAQRLTSQGISTVIIDEEIDFTKLNKKDSEIPHSATYDFSGYRSSHDVTHLIVINVNMLGIHRSYSAYVPTSDPMGVFKGITYLVNLDQNIYELYQPVEIFKGVNDKWDEPPQFPALTNAYYQALEMGKESILKPFSIQ